MVEYLERLVMEGSYSKALSYADHLLLNYENSPHQLVAIHTSVLRCRYHLNEFHGALVSGQLAVKLAEDIEEWDYYGTACFYLGVVWARLGQHEHHIKACYDYLSHLTDYTGAALESHIAIWYNLGVAYTMCGQGYNAVEVLKRGMELAIRTGIPRQVHGLRHALIQAHMLIGQFESVPNLLAQCLCFLRNNPTTAHHRESLLFHFELRAEFAILTNRLQRAYCVAKRGLKFAEGYPENQFHLHMVSAKVSARLGEITEAFGHALSARLQAVQIRRYELEVSAAEFMYELAKTNADAVDKFDGNQFFPRAENANIARSRFN